jgi:tetratricopeptide (TPR) repeat protein
MTSLRSLDGACPRRRHLTAAQPDPLTGGRIHAGGASIYDVWVSGDRTDAELDEVQEAQLDRIFAARDRDNMGPTIAALVPIHERHPRNPRVLYELAGAYDTAGEEARALALYERAMSEGLEGDVLRRCYLQYGSTLRNLDRVDESLDAFARARAEFPDSVSLVVFEALTLHAAGRTNSALGSLLVLLADHVDSEEIERYKPAMRGNADYLISLDAGGSAPSR